MKTTLMTNKPYGNAGAIEPIIFFIHAEGPDSADIMAGPFAAHYETQDQVMDEARAAFVGTDYRPKALLFNIGLSHTDPAFKRATNWRGSESLRLFGIEQGANS